MVVSSQQVFESFSGPAEPGADRGRRNVQQPGDLLRGIPLGIIQVDGDAQLFRQAGHCVPQLCGAAVRFRGRPRQMPPGPAAGETRPGTRPLRPGRSASGTGPAGRRRHRGVPWHCAAGFQPLPCNASFLSFEKRFQPIYAGAGRNVSPWEFFCRTADGRPLYGMLSCQTPGPFCP